MPAATSPNRDCSMALHALHEGSIFTRRFLATGYIEIRQDISNQFQNIFVIWNRFSIRPGGRVAHPMHPEG